VQLVVHSHSDGAAILADDVSLEAAAEAGASNGVPTESTPSPRCSGGGGAGVSFSASHQCATDPTWLFYRIREKGGVPVAFEQIHAMVTLGYQSITCKKPEMDSATTAECPHLSRATLPHLSAADVKLHLDTLSDSKLAAHMGRVVCSFECRPLVSPIRVNQ
jgi:hypothetical protein